MSQCTFGLLTRLVREGVARRELSGNVVDRHRHSAVVPVYSVVVGPLKDDMITRDDVSELLGPGGDPALNMMTNGGTACKRAREQEGQ